MEKCKYYEVCGLEIRNDIESFCILHSTNPKKNQQAFKTALDTHRQRKDHSYEDRRDYERAGHFHVGEKEMRLRNPATRLDLRILLAVY